MTLQMMLPQWQLRDQGLDQSLDPDPDPEASRRLICSGDTSEMN